MGRAVRPYSLKEIADITGGRIAFGDEDRLFTKVNIDSRKTLPGDLFVAIVGERADGHDFVAEVRDKGAGGAVCEHPVQGGDPGPDGFGILMVSSTIGALRDLSSHYRRETTGPSDRRDRERGKDRHQRLPGFGALPEVFDLRKSRQFELAHRPPSGRLRH